jgi:hypothetical protein
LATTTIFNIWFALKKLAKEFGELSLFFGGLLVFAFFQRSLNLILGHQNSSLRTEDIVALGFGIGALLSQALACRLKKTGLWIVSGILGTATCLFAFGLDIGAFPIFLSPTMLAMATLWVLVGARYLCNIGTKGHQESVIFFAGAILSALFYKSSDFIGLNQLFGLTDSKDSLVAIAILNIVWTGFALKFNRPAYWILAWLSFIAAALAAIAGYTTTTPAWLSPTLLSVSITSLAVLYAKAPRKEAEEPPVATLVVLAGWVLMTLFLKQELMRPWIGLKEVAAYTVSWVIIAVILIVCGFKFQRRHLRYWSLAIFMVTVGKVFLVDLSELDSFVRVLMLMLLGFGMVGGGYWYILWRRSHTIAEGQAQDKGTGT